MIDPSIASAFTSAGFPLTVMSPPTTYRSRLPVMLRHVDARCRSLHPHLRRHWYHHFDIRWRRISLIRPFDEHLHPGLTAAHVKIVSLSKIAAHGDGIAIPSRDLHAANEILESAQRL